MSEKVAREEVLDLLSRGKISIDDAVRMLDRTETGKAGPQEDEPLYKAEMDQGYSGDDIVKIKLDEASTVDEPVTNQEAKPITSKDDRVGRQPRWLRVQVVNKQTGKNKVTVNVPFGMVKFGLGIARAFSPEMQGIELDDINEIFNQAEPGLLVDVQDDESNEHVRVFFE